MTQMASVSEIFGDEIRALPCPFCGSQNVLLWLGPSPHMTCRTCEADGPCETRTRARDDIRERQMRAVRQWNQRMGR